MKSSRLALVGLAILLFGWLMLFILPTTRFFAWLILGIGAVTLGAAVVIDFRRMREALASGRGRFGVGTSVTISLFLGIVLVVNAIGVSQFHRFDFTGLDRFTLSTQTKDALGSLEADVEIVTMFTPSVTVTVQEYARNLLAEYAEYTDRLTIRHVDPELQPDEARRYGLVRNEAIAGVVVFRSGERERRVFGGRITTEAEHAFTSAILEVTGIARKTVYFLVGHGEPGLRADYNGVREGLLDALFEVEQLDLARNPGMPDDVAALVIAGPRTALSEAEIAIIGDYVDDNGSLLLLLDPQPDESYVALAERFGVTVRDGTVIDPASFVSPFRTSPLIPPERSGFQIAETFFPGAAAVMPRERLPEGLLIEPLMWTSEEAWLERGEGSLDEAVYDEGDDGEGPLAIGVVVTSATGSGTVTQDATRIIVIGDSDFASSRNFRNAGNSSLILTAINWLTASEEVISIDRRPLVTRRLLLNPEQRRFLHFSSIGLLPALLLIAGGFVWWWRRQ